MALIYCPNCGKQISDTIVSCIHCGYSLKKATGDDKKTFGINHKRANVIRKLIQILGAIPGFVGILLGGGILILGIMTILLATASGESAEKYLASANISFFYLFLVLGLFLVEIFALAKLGKKKSVLFTVSTMFVAAYFVGDAFNLSENITDTLGRYFSGSAFSLFIQIMLFVIPIALAISFVIAGIFTAKKVINQKHTLSIGIVLCFLLIIRNILMCMDNGTISSSVWHTVPTYLWLYSPFLLYLMFYPKNYIMPKYIKALTPPVQQTYAPSEPIQYQQSPSLQNGGVVNTVHRLTSTAAEEILKLKTLLDSGAITESEFESLKNKTMKKFTE